MAVKLKSTGGGSVTLDVPTTASDFLLNLPAVGGNVVTTGDSGTITPAMLNGGQTGLAPAYAARAWVNFDGLTAGTVSIRQAGNVSSITDLGVGTYRINFTTAMIDANYVCLVDMTPSVSNAGSDTFPIGYTTSNVEVRHWEANVMRDSGTVNIAVFR
jgi:hypothetical protein